MVATATWSGRVAAAVAARQVVRSAGGGSVGGGLVGGGSVRGGLMGSVNLWPRGSFASCQGPGARPIAEIQAEEILVVRLLTEELIYLSLPAYHYHDGGGGRPRLRCQWCCSVCVLAKLLHNRNDLMGCSTAGKANHVRFRAMV